MGTEKAHPDVEFRGEKEETPGYHLTQLQVIIILVLSIALIVSVGIFAGVVLPSMNAGHSSGTHAPGTQVSTSKPTSSADSQGGSSTSPSVVTSRPYVAPVPKPTQPTPTSSYAVVNRPRLPTNVVPIQYWFTIEFDMANLNFSGDTIIEVRVTNRTNTIIVHADDMTMTQEPQVTNDRNYNPGTTYYMVSDKGFYKPNQYYYVILQNELTPGIYYLRFRHTAPLSTRLDGLYKYQYARANTGEKIWGVASQCEAFDARRIIPCFDEPALKAMFTTTLIVPRNYTSPLTNMVTNSIREIPGDKTELEHQRTVVMSSYLLAFSITDFDRVEREVDNIIYRIWARKEIKDDGNYALDAAINITTYFTNLLGIRYPLRKQDHISVPKFDSGAMENWGLILYREEYLSYSPSYTDAREKEFIVAIVAHELAHMWFGNWVTMVWWNNLWLNEAFASYFEYIGQVNFAPETKGWDSFVGYDFKTALENDQSTSSHPIVPPENYGPFFDRITYQKGASILRMVHNYIGDQIFYDGLKNYLTNFNYSNAIASDLFFRMNQRSGSINITELMGPWVYQMGYPIVTVARGNGDSGVLTQARYLSNKNLDPSVDPTTQPYRSPYGYKWNIPITWFVGGSTNTINTQMFNISSASLSISWPRNTWIKVNAGTNGFYRVNYDQDNWNALATALSADPTQFSKRDAAGLIIDSLDFAATERLSYKTALSITNYLSKESGYVPWYSTWSTFLNYQRRLAARPSYSHFRNYYLKILKPQVDAIGFVGTGTHEQRLVREIILDAACYQGYEPCVTNAVSMLQNYMQDSVNNAVPTDLKEVVYRYGIMYGGTAEWDFLWNQYHSTVTIPERDKIFYALSFARNPASIRKFLSYSMDPNKIDRGDTYLVMLYLSRNPVARPFVWDFFVENKDWFKTRYGNLRYPAFYASLYFDDDHNYGRVEKFFMDNPENTYYTVRVERNTLNRIKANKAWLENHEARFTAACRDHSM